MRKCLLTLCMSLFVLSGCRGTHYRVLTTVYPIQYLVEQIAKERVECVSISEDALIQRASIIDDYEAQLRQSDALFYISTLEPYYEIYADDFNTAGIDLIDVSEQLGSFPFKRRQVVISDGVKSVEESAYYEGSAFADVDMYYSDPSLWMDLVTMSGMASYLCDYLCERYPSYETEFRANYEKLEIQLAQLDAQYQELKGKDVKIAVMTPNFGLLQQSYGVSIYPIVLSRYGVLPNEEQLAVITDTLRNEGVRYMAIEENLPQDMIDLRLQLINELGLIPVPLDNLTSLSADRIENGADYLKLMQDNRKALQSIAG